MPRYEDRVVEERHQAVAREVLDRTLVGDDDLTDRSVVVAQHLEDLLRRGGLGERREPAGITEERSDLAPMTGEELLAFVAREEVGTEGAVMVDGVGNKQVDDAWVSAPGAEKAARFASAEATRWLEWGARSYFDFALGLALLLFAAAVGRTARVPRPIAYLMGLSGLTYLVQGWVVGSEGFSGTHDILIVLAWVISLAWMVWLVVVAWRMQASAARRLAG